MNQKEKYDAIVVGTGISGGWAAKELCVGFTPCRDMSCDIWRPMWGWIVWLI